jgi:hypothetical protein
LNGNLARVKDRENTTFTYDGNHIIDPIAAILADHLRSAAGSGCGQKLSNNCLNPKQVTGPHGVHGLRCFSMAYEDSGRLLPLIADGAENDFMHIFLHTSFSESTSGFGSNPLMC